MSESQYPSRERQRKLTQERVQQGLCAKCGRKRRQYAYLCDECTKIHNSKRRVRIDRRWKGNRKPPAHPVDPTSVK